MPREKEDVEEVMGPALYTTSSLDAILPDSQGATFICQRMNKNRKITYHVDPLSKYTYTTE